VPKRLGWIANELNSDWIITETVLAKNTEALEQTVSRRTILVKQVTTQQYKIHL
jgi:hypothetical protein